jgi:tetratricopeptide (TPR) repeat protein
LGWAYVWQNKGEPNDRAINEFETAVRCDPNDAKAHYNLGMNYARRGRQEEGYRECETAEKLGSKEATQWLDNGTNRIIDQLLSVFQRYAARPSPDTLDAFREKVQPYLFAIDARFFDLLERRIAQGQSSDELSHMRDLLLQAQTAAAYAEMFKAAAESAVTRYALIHGKRK